LTIEFTNSGCLKCFCFCFTFVWYFRTRYFQ